jgi:hypothetical protein
LSNGLAVPTGTNASKAATGPHGLSPSADGDNSVTPGIPLARVDPRQETVLALFLDTDMAHWQRQDVLSGRAFSVLLHR